MKDLKGTRAPEGGAGRWLRLRIALVGLGFALALGVNLIRAVDLQILQGDKLGAMAEDQHTRVLEIPARRGDIFDRRGGALAQSVDVESIWVDPRKVEDPTRTSRLLAKKLELDPGDLLRRMQRSRAFAWVKRKVRPDEVAKVKALALPGVYFVKEPRRFYPQKELAAHVLGIVGTDGQGLEGVELAFEDELYGEKVKLAGMRDARGRKMLLDGTPPAHEPQGASVTLTLDRQVQYLAERALAKAVEESRAVAGKVVALDPRTGEILALANYPSFNPNAPQGRDHAFVRNRAALDAFEPGSTTKALVVAHALETGAIKPADIFFCENGSYAIGRHTIHDTKPHGWLTPGRILQVSSNIGMAKIASKMGREQLVEAYRAFGFGEKVGLALPGEGRGSIPFPKAEVALATQSFGQGLSSTAVQLAAAYGALANHGVLMRPYLVSKVLDPDGVVLLENTPRPVRQVVSERTAKEVLAMLEGVVSPEGSAPKAKLEGYRVAGKTGTAQKADTVARGYSDKRIASFVGVVPAEDPRLVVLVVIDEPKTDVYGGLVAAPAFREIAAGAMTYLGIPPSQRGSLAAVAPVAVRPEEEPTLASERPGRDAVAVVEEVPAAVGEGAVLVPDLSGKVGREAVTQVLAAALEPRLIGSGRVVSQRPAPGTRVEKGTRITLELEARP